MAGWSWLSPMRILSALRTGRVCLNLFNHGLDDDKPDGGGTEAFSYIMSVDELSAGKAEPILSNPHAYFQDALGAYQDYMHSCANPAFPWQPFHEWAQSESLVHQHHDAISTIK